MPLPRIGRTPCVLEGEQGRDVMKTTTTLAALKAASVLLIAGPAVAATAPAMKPGSAIVISAAPQIIVRIVSIAVLLIQKRNLFNGFAEAQFRFFPFGTEAWERCSPYTAFPERNFHGNYFNRHSAPAAFGRLAVLAS